MKEAEIGKKRNIAVVGHHGSGKTSLIEALLYFTGGTDRLGRIATETPPAIISTRKKIVSTPSTRRSSSAATTTT